MDEKIKQKIEFEHGLGLDYKHFADEEEGHGVAVAAERLHAELHGVTDKQLKARGRRSRMHKVKHKDD